MENTLNFFLAEFVREFLEVPGEEGYPHEVLSLGMGLNPLSSKSSLILCFKVFSMVHSPL